MDKYDLQQRYLALTRTILPGMAAEHRWAVREGGAFMRMVLDHVCGGPWQRRLDPRLRAYKQLTLTQLRLAVEYAEAIAREGEGLALSMNAQCDVWRGGLRLRRVRRRARRMSA